MNISDIVDGNSAVKALNIYTAGISTNPIFAVTHNGTIGLPLPGYTPASSCLGFKFEAHSKVMIFLLT